MPELYGHNKKNGAETIFRGMYTIVIFTFIELVKICVCTVINSEQQLQ